MKRRLLNLPTALSVQLCIAVGLLWVRSELVPRRWGRTLSWSSTLYVDSARGQLTVTHMDWWIATNYWYRRWRRYERRSFPPFNWRTAGFGAEWWTQSERSGNVQATRSVTLPYWFLAATAAAVPAVRGCRRFHRTRRRGLCPTCGYDLRATPLRCPECGTVPESKRV